MLLSLSSSFFFFNDTATTEIYPLPLHDALPICRPPACPPWSPDHARTRTTIAWCSWPDRKSTRLNSSHLVISYAVFCLKKKKHTPLSLYVSRAPRQSQPTYQACNPSTHAPQRPH